MQKTELYEGSTETQYYIRKSGQLMYGKLDFLNSAFGIVPNELNGFESTLDSPAFDVKITVHPSFLIEYLLRREFYELQGNIANGSRRAKRIHVDTFFDMPMTLPSLPEQTAIGNFFRTLDNTITLHKRKLDGLKKLKKAYLQQMFPQNGEKVPRLRFAGFVEEWQDVRLSDVAEFNPRSTLPDSFVYVDLESVVGTSLISFRTENKETAPSRAQRLAKQGDIFFQTVRPYQMNNFLFELPCANYVFSTGYAQLRSNINSYFLLCKLQEKKFVAKVLDRCTGTSYPAINSTDLADIEIGITSKVVEQAAIGNFFRNLDAQTTAQQTKLDKLKQLKQAYLQRMFI